MHKNKKRRNTHFSNNFNVSIWTFKEGNGTENKWLRDVHQINLSVSTFFQFNV